MGQRGQASEPETAPAVESGEVVLANEQADRRFELRRLLGSGGMGVVYEALDRDRDRVVALKVLRHLEPSAVARFKREFRSLARVNHPNLVRLHELLSVDERWLYTMEYIDGVHLTDHVRGAEPGRGLEPGSASVSTALLTAEETCATGAMAAPVVNDASPSPAPDMTTLRDTVAQLAVAVDALHRTGHLHRDLKPSNVLIDQSGRLVLLDFGVIAELGAHEREVIGTPTYMAPEQFTSGAVQTPATDWYALGCVLYQLLTGVRPFVGAPRDIAYAKQNHPPVEPSELVGGIPPEVGALCMAMLDRVPSARPSGDEVHQVMVGRPMPRRSSVGAPRELGALVGRQRHLTVLRAALRRVERGHPASVMIRGRSGMGKSALVRAFLDEVRGTEGVILLEARCHEREDVPYKGIDGIIDALAAHLSSEDQTRVGAFIPKEVTSLERAFPALGAVPAIFAARAVGGSPPAEPLEIRRRAFAGLISILDAIARGSTLIIMIDDLQWGDADTAPFLADLVGEGGPPALFIGCYRDDVGESALLNLITSAVKYEPIRVGRLSLPDAAELAELLLAQHQLKNYVIARRIARESAGVPFLIEEIARYVAQHRLESDALDGLTVDQVIHARVEGLEESARKLLSFVSLAGRPMKRGALEEAAGLGSAFFEVMTALEDANLVSATGTADADLVETYHDRIRDTVLSAVPEEERRKQHLVLAMVLENTGRAAHEDSLRHFAAAGEMGRAAEHALEAGDAALQALAFDRAAHCYRLALAYHTSIDRVAIETKLGDALVYAGRAIEGADAYVGAAASAGPTPESRTLKVRAAAEYLRGGAIDEGLAVVADVLSDFGTSQQSRSRLIASLLVKRAQIWFRSGRFRPRPPASIEPDLLARIDATWQVAAVFGAVDPLRGLEIQSRHMLLALKAGDPIRYSQALLAEAALQSLSGRSAEERCLALADRSQALDQDAVLSIVGWRHGVRGLIHYQAGRWPEALPLLELGESFMRTKCAGVPWESSSAQLFILWDLYYLGRVAEVDRRRRIFHREATERGDLYGAVSLSVGLPTFGAIAAGRTSEVRRDVRTAVEQWSVQGFHLQHYWAGIAKSQCDLYDGEPRDAHERLERMWGDARRAYLLKVQAVRIEFLHLRAVAALSAAAHRDVHERQLISLAASLQRKLANEGVPWATAMSLAVSAGVHALQGEIPAAGRLLDQAASAFSAAGMELFSAAARLHRGALSQRADEVADAQAAGQLMVELGATDPARVAALLVPVFPR